MNQELAVKIWNRNFGVGRQVGVDGCELPMRTVANARMVNGTAMIWLADMDHRLDIKLTELARLRPLPRVMEEVV